MELIASNDLPKNLSLLVRGYFNPEAEEVNLRSVTKILYLILESYEEFLAKREQNNKETVIKISVNDLLSGLEGIERLPEQDCKIIIEKIKNKISH